MAKRKRTTRRSRTARLSPWGAFIVVLAVGAMIGAAIGMWGRGQQRAHVRPAKPAASVAVAPSPDAPQTETPAPQPPTSPSSAPSATATANATSSASPTPIPERSHAPVSGARLAVVIDDCGQWPQIERAMIALPMPLTFSVLPHVRYGHTIAQEALAAHKGVMLHLPMETVSGTNPGAGTITTAMSDDEIVAQVKDDLADVPLATGVNNHEGSRATADARVMKDVIAGLGGRSLFFLDSRTTAATLAQETAADAGMATARRDVFLDNVATTDAVETQLRAAAEVAKKNGSAIAIGHPRETTLAAIRALAPQLQAEGIVFVLAEELTTRT